LARAVGDVEKLGRDVAAPETADAGFTEDVLDRWDGAVDEGVGGGEVVRLEL
jgi:hypothetical protein